MAEKDYYKILGVSRNANLEQVREAYKKLAIQYHPDRNPGNKSAEEKFKEINEAYEVLSDPQKRQMYDQFGESGVKAGAGYQPGGGFTFNFDEIFKDFGFDSGFDEIFDIFGTKTARRKTRVRGSDIEVTYKMELKEILYPKTTTIEFNKFERCDLCGGSGSKPGSGLRNCPTCQGRGEISIRRGFFSLTQTCTSCGGSGKTIANPCNKCNGSGRVKKNAKVSVKIPAGVRNGTTLKVTGAGNAGEQGGSNGDLYIHIIVKEDPRFEIIDDELIYEARINFTTAALGGEITVPTLEGEIKMKIPPGTQSESIFKLKEKGLPRMNQRGRADQLVKILITVPKNLTPEQKELLTKLDKTFHDQQNKDSFFKKIFS